LVISVAAAKLPLIRLTSPQIAKLELIQDKYAASLLGLPADSINLQFAAIEFGWDPVHSFTLKAKFLLAGRIFRADPAVDPNTVAFRSLRVAQIEAGDRQELLGEIFTLLDCDSSHRLWFSTSMLSKNPYKKAVKHYISNYVAKKFMSLKRASPGDSFLSLKPTLSQAKYVSLPLSLRHLVAQTRFSCSNARADNGRPASLCRFCPMSR
jgi:hypothetical protein